VLQSRVRCCGALGYGEYRSDFEDRCVPASCCHDFDPAKPADDPQCTNELSRKKCVDAKVHEWIYMRGCLEIVDDWYRHDLQGLMLVYGVGGTIFALIELVAVFLASAYAAQISRRAKREREVGPHTWAPGVDVAGQYGGEHHQPGGLQRGGGEELPMDENVN